MLNNINLFESKNDNYHFEFKDDNYLVLNSIGIPNRNSGKILVGDLYKMTKREYANESYVSDTDSDNDDENNLIFIKKVVMKFFSPKYKDQYHIELKCHLKISNKFINGFDYNIIFCDTEKLLLMFDYKGIAINDPSYDISKIDIMQKIKMFKQLIDHQKILIEDYGIIHNDIKSANIVVDENNNLYLIDYGITFFVPNDIHNYVDFNTTYSSACNEFYLIGIEQWNNYNDENRKLVITYPLYYKSQHYALASIIIGMLLNDFKYYEKTFCKVFCHDDKKENCENMLLRFKEINETNTIKFRSEIKNKLLENRKNYDKYCTYDKIVQIIMDMLIFDYTKKESLKNISEQINQVLNNKNNILYEDNIICYINELFENTNIEKNVDQSF